jgi:subtilisin family serine protease
VYRVFGCFDDPGFDTIIAAMIKAASNGTDVISMSFGSTGLDDPLQQVVQALGQKGIALFAANGNSGNLGPHRPASPAREDSVFAVGSVVNEKFPLTYEVYRTLLFFSYLSRSRAT